MKEGYILIYGSLHKKCYHATRAAKIPSPHEVNTLYVQNKDLPFKNKRHKFLY